MDSVYDIKEVAEKSMSQLILVVEANKDKSQVLCVLSGHDHYRAIALDSLGSVKEKLQECRCHAVTLDLDSLPVDNRFIRDLKRQNSGLRILLLSERSFHPDLMEAMSDHVYACIRKPMDAEEFIYLLN